MENATLEMRNRFCRCGWRLDWMWGRITEEIGEVTLIDEETVPSLAAWFRNVLEDPKMKDCMPPYDKLLEHNKDFRRFLAASASAPK